MSQSLPSPFRIHEVMAAVHALVQTLEATDPDSDAEALRQAIETETDALTLLRRVIGVFLEAKQLGAATNERIAELQERKRRWESRESAARLTAFAIMEAMRTKKVVQPDFTATISVGRNSVLITDETKVPDQYCKIIRTPKKKDIEEAMKEGVLIDGAEWSNGLDFLTIRSK